MINFKLEPWYTEILLELQDLYARNLCNKSDGLRLQEFQARKYDNFESAKIQTCPSVDHVTAPFKTPLIHPHITQVSVLILLQLEG